MTHNREWQRDYDRRRRLADPEKFRAQSRAWRAANLEYRRRYDRHRRLADPEKLRARDKAWRAANLEYARARSRAWKAANPERSRESSRRWAKNNHARVVELARGYRAKHPERYKEYVSKRRALYAGVKVEPVDRLTIAARDGWRCRYCFKDLTTKTLTLDHRIALSNRGPHTAANLVSCCATCNSSKGDKALEDWFRDPDCPARCPRQLNLFHC